MEPAANADKGQRENVLSARDAGQRNVEAKLGVPEGL